MKLIFYSFGDRVSIVISHEKLINEARLLSTFMREFLSSKTFTKRCLF
ncbi:hypothetical protein IQ272_01120 [Chroococcidiopsidales cyanobacterium LEGE 13417]|nr:hypothetical protein [Chroococcidiopsidales cyanobacterium LEGE 13417]